mgnify:CR=1 FL=1
MAGPYAHMRQANRNQHRGQDAHIVVLAISAASQKGGTG